MLFMNATLCRSLPENVAQSLLVVVQVPGVQPMVSMDDTLECEDIVKADSSVRRMLAERYGITDMASIAADPWYYGDRTGAQNRSPFRGDCCGCAAKVLLWLGLTAHPSAGRRHLTMAVTQLWRLRPHLSQMPDAANVRLLGVCDGCGLMVPETLHRPVIGI